MRKLQFIAAAVLGIMAVSACGNSSCKNNSESASEAGTMSVDEALAQRHSFRAYDAAQELSDQQVLDLLWAANGVSHDDKRTAPSAVNAQDIDLYVCTAKGVSKYDAPAKALTNVTEQDIRPYMKAQNDFAMDAPVMILLVSDQSKFGSDRPGNRNRDFGMMDAGIVSENISLYCTAHGMATVCCAPRMEADSIRTALSLHADNIPILYHPVGYSPKAE